MSEVAPESQQNAATPPPPGRLRKYRLSIYKHQGSQVVETLEIVGAGISFWSDGSTSSMLVVGDEDGNAVYTIPNSRIHSLIDPDYEYGGPQGDPVITLASRVPEKHG